MFRFQFTLRRDFIGYSSESQPNLDISLKQYFSFAQDKDGRNLAANTQQNKKYVKAEMRSEKRTDRERERGQNGRWLGFRCCREPLRAPQSKVTHITILWLRRMPFGLLSSRHRTAKRKPAQNRQQTSERRHSVGA